MAISRFQMNRQLRAYGGIMGQDGRRNYGIGSFFQKYIKDPIERSITGISEEDQEKASQKRVNDREAAGMSSQPVSNYFKDMFFGKETPIDPDTGKPVITPGTTQRSGGLLSGLLSSRVALPLASGLLAGAFTKDKEDPIYTGQDVGLNLQDIGRLANITDPKAGQAMGLRFLPDVESRKFTPEEMAASYAANAPQDFTEQREQAEDGGIMGSQKEFDKFLEDMKQRDMSGMQDQILRDFQRYMERKKMIEQMPEARDGGIMKMAEGGMMASYGYDDAMSETRQLFMQYKKSGIIPMEMEFEEFLELLQGQKQQQQPNRTMAQEGGMMDMGGNEMDLRGGGFVPMGEAERADDVPARLSKNEFVFTADAVRAAGGGNVDKGADKMYATMKKLEDRVA